MASNKECLIIILDVRRCSNEDFKLKSVKCVAEILKDKICSGKKDYVSFVLVGTEKTRNECNDSHFENYYKNVVEYPQVQQANWSLLLDFFKFVNEKPTEEGQWLEAVVVAMNLLKAAQETIKAARQRILMFFDFNDMPQDYQSFDTITENLLSADIDFIVASHDVVYFDNVVTNETQAFFKNYRDGTATALKNQKYALQLITNCNATICNLRESLHTVFQIQNKRPWTWNSKLEIGSKISIDVSAIIAMKEESNIKLKKCYGEHDEIVTREVQYMIKGTEVTPMPEELIEGYMLGGTPVAYDESIVEKPPQKAPGLKFIGFVQSCDVPDEYFCGDSVYLIVHQKGMTASARKLDALVRALSNSRRAVLCWKIFSAKFNQPKLVVLRPNEVQDDSPATLAMIELSYHAQHHFWDFPALKTEKTNCTREQINAVDKLIDSMDLEITLQNSHRERHMPQNDLLPFDQLPHIYEQNVIDVLERKVLCNTDDEHFQRMLNDKNFVEIFWKVPEPIEQSAKKAARELKKLFPLERSSAWLEKLIEKSEPSARPKVKEEPKEDTHVTLDFDKVGLHTPAQDFELLLAHKVLKLQNTTQRDARFNEFAQQMRDIIVQLTDSSDIGGAKDLEKLTLALKTYRKRACEFNTFADYNKWIQQIKTDVVVPKNLRNFWVNVVVKHKLGLCIVGDPTLEDEVRIDEFYTVKQWN